MNNFWKLGFDKNTINGVSVLVVKDRVILDAIRVVCPEFYDVAVENYLKKVECEKK